MGVDAWLWLTDRVNRRALAVTVRHANRTREGVHRMNDKVSFSDTLVAEFKDCFGEAPQPTILSECHHTVTETGNDAIITMDGTIHFREEPFRALLRPMRRESRRPEHAHLGVFRVGLEAGDHFVPPLSSSSSSPFASSSMASMSWRISS